jgi:uncharacterized protein
MNIKLIVAAILEEYSLPIDGHHGVAHWARVLENGRRLRKETRANLDVVTLFAVFHDSRRVNESTDPDHGQRGADLAAELREQVFEMADDDFHVLYLACVGHTSERTHPDVTIQTCWDADRLDLGRVGITPHPSRLCTDVAKRPDTIKWADGRASFAVVPELVVEEWGVELSGDFD